MGKLYFRHDKTPCERSYAIQPRRQGFGKEVDIMASKNNGHTARHYAKHRWNAPDGWSDSDIFGYDTHEAYEDDEIAVEVMKQLYPEKKSGKKSIVKI